MIGKHAVSAISLIATIAVAQTQTRYSPGSYDDEFASKLYEMGYTMETTLVETEDGWTLSLFRIGSTKRGDLDFVSDIPVLFQHGGGTDALYFVDAGNKLDDTAWPFKLADEGYDVYMGNNRGTRFAYKTNQDPNEYDETYWDFSWAEMGKYD